MKTTRRNPHVLRSSLTLGGVVVGFLCLPASARGDDWGFSIRIPFLGFYVGPYHSPYSECFCPLYDDTTERDQPWREQPAPSPIPGLEDDQFREEVHRSNPGGGPPPLGPNRESSSRSPAAGYPGVPPRMTAERYGVPGTSIESQPDEPAAANTEPKVHSDPEVDPQSPTNPPVDTQPQTEPSDNTSSQEDRAEQPESLIPLTGVN